MITDPDPDADPGRILTKNQSFEISLLFFGKQNFVYFIKKRLKYSNP